MNPTLEEDPCPIAGDHFDLRSSPRFEGDEMEMRLECALRHLAVASTQLARQHDVSPEDAARYAAVEARLRSMLEPHRERSMLACPVVETESEGPVSLAVLLIGGCYQFQRGFPIWSIDPALVASARELLSGLNWTLPS
jgi:hypothetical protein